MPLLDSPYNDYRYAAIDICWSREMYNHLRSWGVSMKYFTPVSICEGDVEYSYDEPPQPGYPQEEICVYPQYKCWGKGLDLRKEVKQK